MRPVIKTSPYQLFRLFTFLVFLAMGIVLLSNRRVGLKAWVSVTSRSRASLLSSHDVLSIRAPLSLTSLPRSPVSRQKDQCPDVLHNMLTGRWHQRLMTSEEKDVMRRFYIRVREEEHHLPPGMQRPDGQCGDIGWFDFNIKGTRWYRALCNTEGDTPCCYNNKCVNKTMEECTCANCLDMRRPIQAEYADWRPVDPSCKPQNWPLDEVCRLLANSTVYFIGDSFIRHFYTAFLMTVTGNDVTGALKESTPDDLRPVCSGINMFTEKVCRHQLPYDVRACNGTLKIKLCYEYAVLFHHGIQRNILRLAKTPNSFVVFGIGMHNKFNETLIIDRLLRPLVQTMRAERVTWPKIVWAGVHKFGMVRTNKTTLGNDRVREFNHNIERFLAPWGVPVFDTFNLTDNAMSLDTEHYGFGVNKMKVTILLHYLQQLRSLGQW